MKTLFEAFETAALRYSDKIALIDYHTGASCTYNDLLQNIKIIHNLIKDNKLVNKGDRVALLMSNQVEFIISFFALQAAGAIVVPLNYRLSHEEHGKIINHASVSGIVWSMDFIEPCSTLLQELSWSILADAPLYEQNNRIMENTCFSITDCLLQQSVKHSEITAPNSNQPDDPAVLIYTSGTTGQPKGVILTHANLLEDSRINSIAIEASQNDIFVTASPLFHVFGLTNIMLTALLAGGTVVLVKKFNPKSIMETITRYKVTFLAAVPTMYQMMLSLLPSAAYCLDSLRVCHSGAAPMPRSVFSQIEEYFAAPVQEGYGQSEASSIITSNPLRGERKPGSIGLPLEGLTLEITDEKGNIMPVDEIGEIRVKGKTVMSGYWNNLEATEKTIREGWLYTSDLGYRDKDGYVYIVGRRDDMINVGGSKVYPREIEEILYLHSGVKECVVKGEISDIYYQTITAYIVPKNEVNISALELQKLCRKHLADYKVPKKICFLKQIPKGSTGKILRHKLS